MRFLNIYRKDTRNVGDLKCTPLLYFKFDADQESVDVYEVKNITNFSKYDAVIIGGGGLLHEGEFMPILSQIRNNFQGKIILWGAGLNNHFYKELIYFAPSWATRWRLISSQIRARRADRIEPAVSNDVIWGGRDSWLRACDLVGLRDYGIGFDWVPCASCMDPRLDDYRNKAPEHPLIAIDHPDFLQN